MMRKISGVLMVLLTAVLVCALGAAAWVAGDALVVSRTVSEGRTVADMAENIGRWASQYGGVHVRTEGANARIPGTFLTRSVYATSHDDAGLLQGAKTEGRQEERAAMERIEAYHWKNPALIQREVADVLLNSGSKAQYRLTARTVLNPNNAPNPFEREALTAMQASFAKLSGDGVMRASSADMMRSNKPVAGLEYWRQEAGQLLYARAVVAQKSCLKCHDMPQNAPEFLKTNLQFNGGGGFGYEVGKPVGVISVKVPIPETMTLMRDGMPLSWWAALAVALVAAIGITVLAFWPRPA